MEREGTSRKKSPPSPSPSPFKNVSPFIWEKAGANAPCVKVLLKLF